MQKSAFRPNFWFITLLITSLALFSACTPAEQAVSQEQNPDEDAEILVDDIAKASYGMGFGLAKNVKAQQTDILNVEAFIAGVQDSMADKDQRVSEDELKTAFQVFQAAGVEKQKQAGISSMKAGEEFLAANASKENIVTLESGMQYEILTAGEGPKPAATDKVKTHYHGTLIDGTVFDSSVERGEPATFPVNGVIKGWVEALQLMPVGSKWRLFIPPNLAYGERGAGAKITANATLIFEVELLEIVGG